MDGLTLAHSLTSLDQAAVFCKGLKMSILYKFKSGINMCLTLLVLTQKHRGLHELDESVCSTLDSFSGDKLPNWPMWNSGGCKMAKAARNIRQKVSFAFN